MVCDVNCARELLEIPSAFPVLQKTLHAPRMVPLEKVNLSSSLGRKATLPEAPFYSTSYEEKCYGAKPDAVSIPVLLKKRRKLCFNCQSVVLVLSRLRTARAAHHNQGGQP